MKLSLKNSPYKDLLKNNQFKLWVENLERGSVITAAEYFRRIGHICKTFDTTT
ncbi:MAG: hypothetical protein KGH81_02590 [Thaumarchaeota archaeon]|nr:hypothetical protein [Nitrososphaerota archaeon]